MTVTGPTENALHITGIIAPGTTSTVTYTVEVEAYDEQGNHHLGVTGANGITGIMSIALLTLLGGAAVWIAGSRRKYAER